jgi:hypothetical protein
MPRLSTGLLAGMCASNILGQCLGKADAKMQKFEVFVGERAEVLHMSGHARAHRKRNFWQ